MADTQNSDNQNGAGAPFAEQVKDQVKQQTQQAVQQGQQYAGKAVSVVRDRVKTQIGQQKDHFAGGITDLAQVVRESGDKLREQGLGSLTGPYIDQAAQTLTDFGTSIQQKDVDQVIRETEDFARIQPAIFLGAAATLGFVAARFLKSSSSPLGPSA